MNIRKARFAGSWYSGDPMALRAEIDEFLETSAETYRSLHRKIEEKQKNAAAAVLPHAGLYFSGRGIAHFFNNLDSETERIIIIAPSHYAALSPDLFSYGVFDSFDTPLGEIPGSPAESLGSLEYTAPQQRAVEMEHAVEMFLPFIAHFNVLYKKNLNKRKATVLPLLISQVTGRDILEKLSSALLEWIGVDSLKNKKTAVIASSDFTHYGERFQYTPFGMASVKEVEKHVDTYDRGIAERIIEHKYDEIFTELSLNRPTICGIAPALITAKMMESIGAAGEIADCYTSNRYIEPDTNFVSYCLILWR